MAHGEAYVAQTTPAHLNHFLRTIMEANAYPGPAVVIAYTPCQPEHGIADDASSRQSKLAVESRTFPLFTYDPRRGPTVAERLSLQGNPALKADWATAPDGSPIDFLAFAGPRGGSRHISARTARRRPRSSRHRPIASPAGGASRRWPAWSEAIDSDVRPCA